MIQPEDTYAFGDVCFFFDLWWKNAAITGTLHREMNGRLKTLLTPRFFKFCTVGASGVVVNMLFFFLFSDVLEIHVHLALALAIEISIVSNFTVNEAWTFRDRRGEKGRLWSRVVKFHAVSAAGGAIQWCVFAACNALLLSILTPSAAGNEKVDFVTRYITHPADAGGLKYVSQLIGIGAATLFNFFANVHWTWGQRRELNDEG